MLTTEQISHYQAFGYLVLRQLFSADEAARMKREAADIFEEDRGGRSFTPTAWHAGDLGLMQQLGAVG